LTARTVVQTNCLKIDGLGPADAGLELFKVALSDPGDLWLNATPHSKCAPGALPARSICVPVYHRQRGSVEAHLTVVFAARSRSIERHHTSTTCAATCS